MPDLFTFTSVTRVTPNGGTIAGGTAVTITGFGFDFATGGVTMGGSAMTSVVFVSNTSITAVTPAHNVGAVDVVVAGVGTGSALYTYSNPSTLLMPPVPVTADGKLDPVGTPKWLMEAKRRIEALQLVDSGSIIGPIAVDQVPQLPFTKIDLTTSPRLLGRTTAGAGAAEEIEVAAGLTLSAGVLSLSGLPGGYVIGDLLYADSANSLARLADVAVGSYLRSGGVATAPLWSTLTLPNTGIVGDLPFVSATNVVTMLADVSVGSYLRSGGVTTAPLWSTLKIPNAANSGDILRASSANTYASVAPEAFVRVNDTNVTATLTGTPTAALVNTLTMTLGWTGQLAVPRGGTGLSTVLTGELLYGSATDVLSRRTIGSTGDVLTVSGGLPVWAAAAAVATAVTITDDTTTNATMFPTWVTTASGNQSVKVSSTKITFNPSTATLTCALAVHGTSISSPSHISTGAITMTPASGSNLNVSLATTGDLVVNTSQLVVDTSAASVGIGTASPATTLHVNGSIFVTSQLAPSTGTGIVTSWSIASDNGEIRARNEGSGAYKQITFKGSTFIMATGASGTTNALYVDVNQRVGIGVASPGAMLHLQAGTTVAGTAPLRFNSGSLLTAPVAGTVEFLTDDYYATITTGAARKGIVLNDGTALTATRVPFATTNGRLTDDSDMTFATDTLTVTKLSAPTSVSTGTLAQTGKTTTYNNVATVGWGEPAIYGSGRSTAQVAAVASVATYTMGAADGSVDVSANVNVTTSTTHNFAVQVAYTDETNTARTLVLTLSTEAGVLVTAITNVTGAGIYDGFSVRLRCKASTAITVKTAGTFTTVTYNVEADIQQVA